MKKGRKMNTVKNILNDSPITRMVLTVIIMPLVFSVVAYGSFKVITENHMDDEIRHVTELQSQQISTIPKMAKDISNIELDLLNQKADHAKLSTRIAVVEQGVLAIQSIQEKQDDKLDQIVTLLLEKKP